jgi:hypothetical protein
MYTVAPEMARCRLSQQKIPSTYAVQRMRVSAFTSLRTASSSVSAAIGNVTVSSHPRSRICGLRSTMEPSSRSCTAAQVASRRVLSKTIPPV